MNVNIKFGLRESSLNAGLLMDAIFQLEEGLQNAVQLEDCQLHWRLDDYPGGSITIVAWLCKKVSVINPAGDPDSLLSFELLPFGEKMVVEATVVAGDVVFSAFRRTMSFEAVVQAWTSTLKRIQQQHFGAGV